MKKLLTLTLAFFLFAACTHGPDGKGSDYKKGKKHEYSEKYDKKDKQYKKKHDTAEKEKMADEEFIMEYTMDMANFSFTPNMIEMKAGETIKIKLVNVEGKHDFVIDELAVQSSVLETGGEEVIEITTPADSAEKEYAFYCSIGRHRENGMEGVLKITAGDSKDEHMHHGGESAMTTDDRLNNSPRHHEWVEVQNGDKTIHTWVVYPEMSENTPVVILIHENRGLNDWARSMADQVAEAGYIAVAPDLLSGFSNTQTRTSDFADAAAARDALYTLDMDNVMSDLQAVADWAKTIPAANGKLVSAGFCWGGARSFQFASVSADLEASLVFYGTGPEEQSAYEAISAPVYGFYGGNDDRVNATIEQSEQYMTAAGKTYEYEIYDGAGHAFMRSGADPNGDAANITARDAAWERMKGILAGL